MKFVLATLCLFALFASDADAGCGRSRGRFRERRATISRTVIRTSSVRSVGNCSGGACQVPMAVPAKK